VNRITDQLAERSSHATRDMGKGTSPHRQAEVHGSRGTNRERHWNSDSEIARNFHRDGRNDRFGQADREKVSQRNMDRDYVKDTDAYMHKPRDMDMLFGTGKDQYTETLRDAFYETSSNIRASRDGQGHGDVRTHSPKIRDWDQHAVGVAHREEAKHDSNHGQKNGVRDMEFGRAKHLGAESEVGSHMDTRRLRDVDADILGEGGRGQDTRRHADSDLVTAIDRRDRDALMQKHVDATADQDRRATNVDAPFLRHQEATSTCQKQSHVDHVAEELTDEKRTHADRQMPPEARGSRNDSENIQGGIIDGEGRCDSACAQDDTARRKDRMQQSTRLRTQQSGADMQLELEEDALIGKEQALETTLERHGAELDMRADERTASERDIWRDKTSRPHEEKYAPGMHATRSPEYNAAVGMRANVLIGTSNLEDCGLGMPASTPQVPRSQIAVMPIFTQTPQSRTAGAAWQDGESLKKGVEDTFGNSKEGCVRETVMTSTPAHMVKARDDQPPLETDETSSGSRIMCAQEQYENSNSSAAESSAVQCTQVCVCVCDT
jgi:hypothetical protein